MAKATHPANSIARANSSVRSEPKTDEGHVNDQRCQANPKISFENEEEELKTREAKPVAARAAACLKLRMKSGGHWMVRRKQLSSISSVNHRRLGRLLDLLAAGHQWREASAVLSTLFAGHPCHYSPSEDRKNFMIAMEIQKRFCWNKNYHNLIKSTYEIWLRKLSMHKKGHAKIHLLQLELALFYLTQEKFTEAHFYTRFIVTEGYICEPFINLIHGLILYQLWYADLPEEMQIKGFDAQTSSDAFGLTLIDGFQETEICESSNGHDAVDIENSKASYQCSSESSVGNEKIFMVGKCDAPRKNSVDAFNAQDHISQCDEERGLPINQDNFVNTSIYFASGLDKGLLPIQLKLLTEDPIQSILLYRKLANEKYRDAVKHLRLALHSTPPLLAALLPLIQLLLLGDQVHEAFVELDKSCHELDSALPFRLKARLLQCFCSSEISTISSCYESALTRDPACNLSMERLIKMHKTGNYSVIPLVETLAKHLDAVDGKCSIWEEFASCFLELQTSMLFHREDCMSANTGVVTDNVCCNRIPSMFAEGETGDTWRLRCRWWVSRHFGRSISLSEIQAGEWMLLQFKAACAIHLYGPNFEYVTAVLNSLTQQGNASQLPYLNIHIKNPMNIRDNLAEL